MLRLFKISEILYFIICITPRTLQVYSGSLHKTTPYASIFCIKSTTSAEVVQKALDKFGITDHAGEFQLAEVLILQI